MFLQKTTSWVLLIFCVPIVIFLSNEGLAQKPHRVSSRIVTSFPSPGPSPQELAWDGQFLWVADDSTDLIYKLDPSNGNVLLSFSAPESEPRGLTWDGAHLWLSDNQATKIYKFDVSGPSLGTPTSSIDAPVINLGTRGHSPIGGLAWDGEYLWCGNIAGLSSRMNRINPTDAR
jgi:streptogramin lyase